MMLRRFIVIALLAFLSGQSWSQRAQTPMDWRVVIQLPESGLAGSGVAGALTGVHNDHLLLAGGADFPENMPWNGGVKKFYDVIMVAAKSATGEYQWISSGTRLPTTMAYSANATSPAGIVCVGGQNENGISDHVWLLRWSATEQAIVDTLPSLPYPVTNAAAVAVGKTVYVFGGESAAGTGKLTYALNLDMPGRGWQRLADVPHAVSHAVAVVQSDGKRPCVFLIGGRSKSKTGETQFFGMVHKYDPHTGEWHQMSSLPGRGSGISAGTGIATGASYILLLGGDDGNVFSQLEKYDAGIKTGTPETVAVLRPLRDSVLMSHKGFSKQVLLYNTITDTWSPYDTLPYGPVTTTAVPWGADIIVASGEVRPGIRTRSVLAGKVRSEHYFSWIDMLVIIASLALMTVVRFFFTREQSTAEGYFKGGKRIPKWAAGISIFGAKLSAITFMGIPAKTYASDWTYFFLLMTIIMIMPVVSRFFIPFYRRMNVTSAYEYLEGRFNSSTRMLASLLYIFLQLGRMGIVVVLPSIALTLVTGVDVNICILLIGAISIFFTVKGGIEAVIWVEVIQVMILSGGALLCLIYLPFHIGDVGNAFTSLKEYDKLRVFDFSFDFTTQTFWVVVIGGLAINLFTYGADQTTVQRYLTTATEAQAKKSLRMGAWLTLPSTLVFFSIGTLLFLFFRAHPDEVNVSLNNADNIFPWFIVSQLPAGLAGLAIAGIFASAMSSTEASMNSVATLLTSDFYKKFKPGAGEKKVLRFARLTTLITGIFVTAIGLWMAHHGISSLWDQFNTILGLFTGCITGAFLLGIFTTHANGTGVLIGMALSCGLQLFISNFTSVNFLLYSFTGMTSCIVLGYVCSYFFKNTNDIAGLTIYRGRSGLKSV